MLYKTEESKLRIKGIIYVSITALFWGFLPIFLKIALKKVDSFTVVWFRFTLAFLVLFLYFAFRQPAQLKIFLRPTLPLILAPLVLAFNYIGFMQGIHYTSPNNAQVIIQLGPVLLALSGFIIHKEKLTWLRALGFILAGVGLFLFYNDQIKEMFGKESIYNTGMVWLVSGAFAWMLFANIQKQLVQKYHPQQLNMFIYGGASLAGLFFATPSRLGILPFDYWLLLIYLGVNTLIAYGCLALALKYLETNKISIVITCNPILTFITTGILTFLDIAWIEPEYFSITSITGALLVISGAIFAVLFRKKEKN